MFRSQRLLAAARLLGLAAAIALLVGTAQAQTRPFAITGVGAGPSGLPLPGLPAQPHWVVGAATQLGLHYGEGSVKTDNAVFDFPNGRITGEFGSGPEGFVFKGLLGDRLACNYGNVSAGASQPGRFELTIVEVLPGNALLVDALFIAEFVAVPGKSTGKFAGVTGSWTMYAWTLEPFVLGSDDPVYYAWAGAGRLTFKRP